MPSSPRRRQEKKVRRHNKNQVDKFFIFSRTKKIKSHREFPRRLLVRGRCLVPHLGVYFFYFPRLSLKHKKCTVFFFVFIIHLSTTHRIHDTIPPLFLLLLSHRPLFTHCSVPPPTKPPSLLTAAASKKSASQHRRVSLLELVGLWENWEGGGRIAGARGCLGGRNSTNVSLYMGE